MTLPRPPKAALAAIVLTLLATPAFAHSGHGEVSGFVAGISHPIFGADHLLAMLAVGLWSGFVLPGRVWAGAASFILGMLGGALLSWNGVPIPIVESLIGLSVVAFGLLTLFSQRGQSPAFTRATLAAIGAFALCHGHAHATEASGDAFAYVTGFVLATAALHLAGILLARKIAVASWARPAIGAGIAAAGLALMAA